MFSSWCGARGDVPTVSGRHEGGVLGARAALDVEGRLRDGGVGVRSGVVNDRGVAAGLVDSAESNGTKEADR